MRTISIVGLVILGNWLPAQAQIQARNGVVKFENLSHETITIADISYTNSAGSEIAMSGALTLCPGEYVPFAVKTQDGASSPMMASNVRYALKTADGCSERWVSNEDAFLRVPEWTSKTQWILRQTIEDSDLKELRAKTPWPTDKGAATYRYWVEIHQIHRDETKRGIDEGGFLDFSTVARMLRNAGRRIKDLQTEGVDRDLLDAAKQWAEINLKSAKQVDERSGNILLVLGGLFGSKGASANDLRDENKELADRTADVIEEIRSLRKQLSKRHGLPLSPLWPEIGAALQPFAITNGYYILLKAAGPDDIRNVKLEYRDPDGDYSVEKKIADLPYSPNVVSNWLTIDPSEWGWRIKRGGWIIISYEGGCCPLSTDELMKN